MRWKSDDDVVEVGFDVEDAVSRACYPGSLFGGLGVGGYGGAFGFFFEKGDVVDADREEGPEAGGFDGEEVRDGEGDVGEDRDVVDWGVG